MLGYSPQGRGGDFHEGKNVFNRVFVKEIFCCMNNSVITKKEGRS